MELPPFSIEQLSQLAASNTPPSQLFEILSRYEPEACLMAAGAGHADPQLLSLFYSSFFFAHLLAEQVSVLPSHSYGSVTNESLILHRPEARALTQRIPEALRHSDPTLQNCLVLLRAVWQTQHAQVYKILRELPWPEALRPLVRRYESMYPRNRRRLSIAHACSGFFQDQTLIAVSTSYEAIRPATAADYLGLDPQAAEKGDQSILQKFIDCGWTWNSESHLLHPVPITVPSADKRTPNGIRDAVAMLGTRGS